MQLRQHTELTEKRSSDTETGRIGRPVHGTREAVEARQVFALEAAHLFERLAQLAGQPIGRVSRSGSWWGHSSRGPIFGRWLLPGDESALHGFHQETELELRGSTETTTLPKIGLASGSVAKQRPPHY